MNIFDHIIDEEYIMGISPLRLVPTGDEKKIFYEFLVYTVATPIPIKSPLFDGTREDHKASAVQWQQAYCSYYAAIAEANGPEPRGQYIESLRKALGEAEQPRSRIILPGQ